MTSPFIGIEFDDETMALVHECWLTPRKKKQSFWSLTGNRKIGKRFGWLKNQHILGHYMKSLGDCFKQIN